ncbi:MAG: hypothetical protein AAF487_08135 [Bacteroidota bacterium]
MFFYNLLNYVMLPSEEEYLMQQEMIEEMMDEQTTELPSFFEGIMDKSFEAMELMPMVLGIALIGLLIRLFGVIFMFKMKRKGFYPYVIGMLIHYIGPIVILGPLLGIQYIFLLIVGIGFIIMYGLNIKHMT